MATYTSFKKINTTAIVDLSITSGDLAATTVSTTNLAAGAIDATKMSNVVTSAKLASTLDLSTKTPTYRAIVDGDFANTAGISGTKLASGAVTASLGFTPVNSAGDTLDASIPLSLTTTTSTSAPNLYRAGDTNTGISIEASTVRIVAGGVEYAVIDSSLRVTRPNHPAFAVSATNGWLYASNYGGTGTFECGSVMGWNNASHQTGGSNWNPSNGRYTAPVTGYYVFHTCWYHLNDSYGTPSYVHNWIAPNGNINWMTGGRTPYNINMHGNRNQYDDGANYSAVFRLNATEYASVWIRWHSYNSRHHAGHQIFSGHLIG